MRFRRHRSMGWVLLLAVAGAQGTTLAEPASAPVHLRTLSRDDITWLRRISFGLTSAELAHFSKLGRARFLDEQLEDRDGPLPPTIAAMLSSDEALNTPVETLMRQWHAEQVHIKAMPPGEDRQAAKKALRKHGQQLLRQARQIELLHAVYGPDQLKEQLVWFWLNHFSIYGAKRQVRWMAADYAEHTIRPHALGKFKDLVMATLQSPAMLEYLDNANNNKNKVNENYARELMELHVLGVGSGYTQQDVQQLARVLTGVGVVPFKARARPRGWRWQSMAVRQGLFLFNPAHHEFGPKTLLGQPLDGEGFDEVRQAVDLLTRQPACAQLICSELAAYFVSDPPPALVAKMAHTFRRTDGDISAVMRTLFESKAVTAGAGAQFVDPTHFVVSAVRLVTDGAPISNPQPLLNWLNQMGEPVFGRSTPDGWPLAPVDWSSSGQLAKRFEIAKVVGSGRNALFRPEGSPRMQTAVPALDGRVVRTAFEPHLRPDTKATLAQAQGPAEWNTFLLASPDFNER